MAFGRKETEKCALSFLAIIIIQMRLSNATNYDCKGKAFYCLNSTHFMICVDLGDGVSTAVEDFVIPCPSPTICTENNVFECEYQTITPNPKVRSEEIEPASERILQASRNDIDFTTIIPLLYNDDSVKSEKYYDKNVEQPTSVTLKQGYPFETEILQTESTKAKIVTKSPINIETTDPIQEDIHVSNFAKEIIATENAKDSVAGVYDYITTESLRQSSIIEDTNSTQPLNISEATVSRKYSTGYDIENNFDTVMTTTLSESAITKETKRFQPRKDVLKAMVDEEYDYTTTSNYEVDLNTLSKTILVENSTVDTKSYQPVENISESIVTEDYSHITISKYEHQYQFMSTTTTETSKPKEITTQPVNYILKESDTSTSTYQTDTVNTTNLSEPTTTEENINSQPIENGTKAFVSGVHDYATNYEHYFDIVNTVASTESSYGERISLETEKTQPLQNVTENADYISTSTYEYLFDTGSTNLPEIDTTKETKVTLPVNVTKDVEPENYNYLITSNNENYFDTVMTTPINSSTAYTKIYRPAENKSEDNMLNRYSHRRTPYYTDQFETVSTVTVTDRVTSEENKSTQSMNEISKVTNYISPMSYDHYFDTVSTKATTIAESITAEKISQPIDSVLKDLPSQFEITKSNYDNHFETVITTTASDSSKSEKYKTNQNINIIDKVSQTSQLLNQEEMSTHLPYNLDVTTQFIAQESYTPTNTPLGNPLRNPLERIEIIKRTSDKINSIVGPEMEKEINTYSNMYVTQDKINESNINYPEVNIPVELLKNEYNLTDVTVNSIIEVDNVANLYPTTKYYGDYQKLIETNTEINVLNKDRPDTTNINASIGPKSQQANLNILEELEKLNLNPPMTSTSLTTTTDVPDEYTEPIITENPYFLDSSVQVSTENFVYLSTDLGQKSNISVETSSQLLRETSPSPSIAYIPETSSLENIATKQYNEKRAIESEDRTDLSNNKKAIINIFSAQPKPAASYITSKDNLYAGLHSTTNVYEPVTNQIIFDPESIKTADGYNIKSTTVSNKASLETLINNVNVPFEEITTISNQRTEDSLLPYKETDTSTTVMNKSNSNKLLLDVFTSTETYTSEIQPQHITENNSITSHSSNIGTETSTYRNTDTLTIQYEDPFLSKDEKSESSQTFYILRKQQRIDKPPSYESPDSTDGIKNIIQINNSNTISTDIPKQSVSHINTENVTENPNPKSNEIIEDANMIQNEFSDVTLMTEAQPIITTSSGVPSQFINSKISTLSRVTKNNHTSDIQSTLSEAERNNNSNSFSSLEVKNGNMTLIKVDLETEGTLINYNIPIVLNLFHDNKTQTKDYLTVDAVLNSAEAKFNQTYNRISKPEQEDSTLNTTFNNKTMVKVNKANGTLPVVRTVVNFTCQHAYRGKYPDKHNCQSFYMCVSTGQPIVGHCPQNSVFSEILNRCTTNLSHCIRKNQFQCIAAGRFGDIWSSDIYYICVRRREKFLRFKMTCQRGYYLNRSTVACVEEPVMVPLRTQASLSTESLSTSSIDSKSGQAQDNDEFECDTEGKYPDPNDCRRYYECKKDSKSEIRLKKKKCDSDEVFNKKKKKCVDEDSYECYNE